MSLQKDFPYKETDKIFFDNASTTKKPNQVIQKVKEYLEDPVNAGRGSYQQTNQIQQQIQKSREKIKNHINANSTEEIIFTSGATDSSNKIPQIWGHQLKKGEKVLIPEDAHQSTTKPWKKLTKSEVNIQTYKTDKGEPIIEDIKEKANEKTKAIILTHIHNKYGTKAKIEKISHMVPKSTKVIIDVCQSISHKKIDVKKLNADFLYFSGHKMYATTGIGVLYINKELENQIKPIQYGGGEQTAKLHKKLEAGTPHITGILSLKEALKYIETQGKDKIEARIQKLSSKLQKELENMPAVDIKAPEKQKEGIISFELKDVNSQELGFILESQGIQVRSGKHCNKNSNETVRASLQIYNTEEEINQFISTLKDVSGLKIRKARKHEAEKISELDKKSWKAAYKEIFEEKDFEKVIENENPLNIRKIHQYIEKDNADVYIAEIKEEVIAYTVVIYGKEVRPCLEDFDAELLKIYVDPEYWRQGIGTKLLEKAEKKLHSNIETIAVETFSENKKSVEFYKKQGYQSKRTSYWKTTEKTYNTTVLTKKL